MNSSKNIDNDSNVKVWFRSYPPKDFLGLSFHTHFEFILEKANLGLESYADLIQVVFSLDPLHFDLSMSFRWKSPNWSIWNKTRHELQLDPVDHKKILDYLFFDRNKPRPPMPLDIMKKVCDLVIKSEGELNRSIATLISTNAFFKPYESSNPIIMDFARSPFCSQAQHRKDEKLAAETKPVDLCQSPRAGKS